MADALLQGKHFRRPQKASQRLEEIRAVGAGEARLRRIVASAEASAAPDEALANLSTLLTATEARARFGEITDDRALLARLTTVLGGSQFLARILFRRPELVWEAIAAEDLGGERTAAEHAEALYAALPQGATPADLHRALRVHKQREILRIGARDLTGAGDLESVTRDLSDLAAGACEVATRFLLEDLARRHGRPFFVDERGVEREAGFCVLGMGKLGARELNFSSDVDLIYLHETDQGRLVRADGSESDLSLREFFHRLAREVTAAIGEVTEDGFVFRVDLRLRPDGTKGAISHSLRAMELYYESFGQTWERAALMKARPIAGDLALGRRFQEATEPFVFRRFLDYTMVEEMKAMKEKINRELERKRETDRDVKLGLGGIREIEFFVQAHQLIHAGRARGLRIRPTVKALEKLAERGLVRREEAEALIQAYRFLRRLEHRIQIDEERQSHLMPLEPEQVAKIARLMGAKEYGEAAAEALRRELASTTTKAHALYDELFYEARRRTEAERSPLLESLIAGETPEPEARERLKGLGFEDADRALGVLARMREGPAKLSERARRELALLAPRLLAAASASPNPDQALLGVDRFLAAVGARTAYYALLAENPGVVERLVRLFGSSEFLSAFLIAHPWLLDPLIRSDSASVRKTPERVAAELREQMVHAVDLEEKLAVLRRFKNEETLRIGVHDLQEELDIDEATRQLSYVAEACLGGALAIAEEQLRPRYGTPFEAGGPPATFAVIGMGKLGSRELNYNSDLDVIFLYSAGGETRSGARSISNQEYFVKLAQRIITALTTVTADGAVYAIDTRLRPSGNQGSLVTTGTAFVDYHRRTAALWERQALLKARAVAGDLPFGERALAEVRDYMWTLPFTTLDLAEIRRLRARMGEELARKGGDATRNLKYGPGGLIDVEFLVQAGQLQRGSRNVPPEDRPVAPGLRMMKEMGLLTAEEADALAEGYRFLRRLENRLRIVHDQADEALPEDPRLLTPLALRMGFAGEGAAEQLLARYREATAAIEKIVKSAFERLETVVEPA